MMRPAIPRTARPVSRMAPRRKHVRAQYEARAVGVTRFGLRIRIQSARLPLPPSREQTRIAAYLDASCAAIDAAVAAKRQQIDTLEDVRTDSSSWQSRGPR